MSRPAVYPAAPRLAPRSWMAVATLVLVTVAPAAWTAPERGQSVPIRGQVIDAQGQPISGVVVVLEASRTRFSLRKLGQVRGAPLRQPVTADADGRYQLDWTWDGHHNTFELTAGFEARYGDRRGYEILARREITPVVIEGGGQVDLTIENADYARWLGNYLQGRASDDEGRIFREMGRPDELVVEPAEVGEPRVSAWWYFADGKVHRFHDGRLHETIDFDPVKPDPRELEGR